MNENTCGACLFRDTCPSSKTRYFACEHFYHLDECYEDSIDSYIEDRRAEFYDEWKAYLYEEQDELHIF